jgi:hypothetical protein
MKGTKNTANLRIADLKKDYVSNVLKSNPEYQRYNNAWGTAQKGSLIISILENYPIGEIIRRKISDDGVNENFEIVDGLQRLSAITDFVTDKLRLNAENSNKVFNDFLPHFQLSTESDVHKLLDKFNNNKTVKLTFNDLPISLKLKIENAEVSVSTLINWQYNDVIEYFRRVQEGKPLSNADKLHTIQSKLTTVVKKLANNEHTLNCLGFNNTGGDRDIYQTILEAMYCKLGNSIGQPKKLDTYYKNKQYDTYQEECVNIIANYLDNINDTDKRYLNEKVTKTDLKLMFCLMLFGDNVFKNHNIKDTLKYILSISSLSSYIKIDNIKNDSTTKNNLYDKLNEYNLTSTFEQYKDDFYKFAELRSGTKSYNEVNDIVSKIAGAFIYNPNYNLSLQTAL